MFCDSPCKPYISDPFGHIQCQIFGNNGASHPRVGGEIL
jgi:hypothetical protein